jgi:polyphosphate kinase 2 (PPK2 family)
LTAGGVIVVKFWLHISKEEQLRRFRGREETSYKRWKLTAEDWRNREKWDQYTLAVEDMLVKTSTTSAPWTVVEANFKWFARVKCLRTLVHSVSAALNSKKNSSKKNDSKKNHH